MKAWIIKNCLTEDPFDFMGVVDSNGSINVNGIVDEMAAEGMELKRETAIDIISRFSRKCIDLTLAGYNVNTGLVNMRVTIRGAFYDKKWNPERNRLHVSISPGIDMRNAIAETEVDILGEHGEITVLFNITDLSTGKTDGTLTRGFNAELRGTFIKILGDDPTVGVWLHNTNTGDELQLPAVNIVINEPSRLLLLIPATLAQGEYELRVVTQASSNNKPLKTPRSATLATPVQVE
jgi:hypothetical protein